MIDATGRVIWHPQAAAFARTLTDDALLQRYLDDKRSPYEDLIDLLIGDGDGGIFVKGWVRDPHQLMDSVALTAAGMSPVRLDQSWLCFPRPDIDRHYDSYSRPITDTIYPTTSRRNQVNRI